MSTSPSETKIVALCRVNEDTWDCEWRIQSNITRGCDLESSVTFDQPKAWRTRFQLDDSVIDQ